MIPNRRTKKGPNQDDPQTVLERRGWGLLVEHVEGEELTDQARRLEELARIGIVGQGAASAPCAPVQTFLSDSLQAVSSAAAGGTVLISRGALAALARGQRVGFLEVFCGQMHLTLGVLAVSLRAPWAKLASLLDRALRGPSAWEP